MWCWWPPRPGVAATAAIPPPSPPSSSPPPPPPPGRACRRRCRTPSLRVGDGAARSLAACVSPSSGNSRGRPPAPNTSRDVTGPPPPSPRPLSHGLAPAWPPREHEVRQQRSYLVERRAQKSSGAATAADGEAEERGGATYRPRLLPCHRPPSWGRRRAPHKPREAPPQAASDWMKSGTLNCRRKERESASADVRLDALRTRAS